MEQTLQMPRFAGRYIVSIGATVGAATLPPQLLVANRNKTFSNNSLNIQKIEQNQSNYFLD
jgi:hypothetical protein